VTLGTYGGATSIPVLAIDAKGRVTTASTSAITSNTGFRNRIINGDMRIDQRNAGASVTATTTVVPTYTLDRWAYYCTQASKFTIQRNAGSVTPPSGYSNYIGLVSSSAYSVISTDNFQIIQRIEGFNTSDLAFGTGSAKTITISFWVYSSLTGTFGGEINNDAGTQYYPFSFSISSANTWEQKTITIAGSTTGTWASDNSNGLQFSISLGMGSTLVGTAGAWTSSQILAPTGSVNLVATNGAYLYITGVQLEAGSTATDFERRPIGTELALCQRYFSRTDSFNAVGASSSTVISTISFPVEMKSNPTIDTTGVIKVTDTVSGDYTQNSKGAAIVNSTRVTKTGVSIEFSNFPATITTYRPLPSIPNETSYVTFSAEL
jgi:hypothetical protein